MVTVINAQTVYSWFRRIIEKSSRVHYGSDIIHVGEVSGCLRKAYYDRKSLKATLDIKNVIMAIGNGVHVALQDLLREEGWIDELEVEWNLGKFKLVGHVDLYNPRENIVLEIKTTGKVPEKPYLPHLRQLNAYLIMSKARKGYLIYIGKDGKVRVFDLKPGKRLWKETVKRAFHLWYSLRENRPPKPEFSLLCSFCEHRWRCFSFKKGGQGVGNRG